MSNQRDKRIAIIGAGPGGLAAAEALREKGYTNIVIFERSGQAGGQSLSREYVTPDKRTLVYDLGSVQPASSKILKRLFKSYGIGFGRGPLEKKSKVIYAFSYIDNSEFANFPKYFFGAPIKHLPAMVSDLVKLSYYLWRYRRLARPGFHGFQYWDETTGDIRTWLEARKFKFLGERLVALLVGALTLNNNSKEGQVAVYQFFKAIYPLMNFPMRYIDGTYRGVREGFQELWKRIARNFDIRFGADITRITRNETGVRIATSDGDYRFDALIVSCTFDRIADVIDASADEKNAFDDLHYSPGYRAAFVAKNGFSDSVHWYPDSYTSGDAHPYLTFAVPEGQVEPDTQLYSCMFSACPTGEGAVEMLQRSAQTMFKEQYGAEIIEWVAMRYWPNYGASFDVEKVHSGVFDTIQAMQGDNHTFYVGQLLSLAGHAVVTEYSYELVDTFFGA